MKILVIGCGSIGRRHAENAARMAEAAVFDADQNAAKALASTLRIKAFGTLGEALSWAPHGVVVATPHHTHLAVASAAVEVGAHVLIEKPISHGPEGMEAFFQKAEASGRKVFVVCNMRFHPAVAALKEHLGEIGQPLFARAHYGNYLPNMRPGADYRTLYCARKEQGGGVVLDAIHEIDYLTWFFGGVESVFGEAGRLSDLDIDVEDYAEITLRHLNGVRTQIHLDYLRPFKRRGCEICGTRGMLLWQSEGKSPENCTVALYRDERNRWDEILSTDHLDGGMPLYRVMEHFVKALQGEDVPLLTGRRAAGVLAVTLAAKESALLGLPKGGRIELEP